MFLQDVVDFFSILTLLSHFQFELQLLKLET